LALVSFRCTASTAPRYSFVRTAAVLAAFAVLTSCQIRGAAAVTDARSNEDHVVAAAGWTRIAATDTYLVVANVLPGEQMFTAAEAQEQHPIEGELIISGTGRALGVDSRHVEAHVYDRSTGLPLANLKPHIVLLNRTTGQHIEVESTLMQDVNIGAIDIHYGNNVTVVGNSDLRLTVTIGDEEAILDGHLD
jgi:mRNA degradation ribonuclease J1/J2